MTVQTNTYETLRYDEALCIGCEMCSDVCPHAVFEKNGRVVRLVAVERCIECGACARNCPTEAITVEVGVGCATALIMSALTGREIRCGGADPSACCGAEEKTASCC